MGTKKVEINKRGLVLRHPNYLVGFIVWFCAIVSLVLFPKLGFLKKKCPQCSEYSRFIDTLSVEKKSKLEMFEAGVLDVGGKFLYIGEDSPNEFELNKNADIFYESFYPELDEKTRRLNDINVILRSLPMAERDLIFKRKAVILYRNDSYVMIGDKNALK